MDIKIRENERILYQFSEFVIILEIIYINFPLDS